MRNPAAALFLAFAFSGAFGQELLPLRMGTLNLSVPSTWKFAGGTGQRAEGQGPDGESVIVSYRWLKPGAPPDVAEQHLKMVRGFAATQMPVLAAKDNKKVLRAVTETALPENRVQFSSVSQDKRGLRDYYFLQYLLGSSRTMVYVTVEGFGNAADAAGRFESILATQRWEE